MNITPGPISTCYPVFVFCFTFTFTFIRGGPGAHFTDDCSIVIQIRKKINLSVTPFKRFHTDAQFCICHDITIVAQCAKFHSDHCITTGMRAEYNFHRTWITMQKSFAKWAFCLATIKHTIHSNSPQLRLQDPGVRHWCNLRYSQWTWNVTVLSLLKRKFSQYVNICVIARTGNCQNDNFRCRQATVECRYTCSNEIQQFWSFLFCDPGQKLNKDYNEWWN